MWLKPPLWSSQHRCKMPDIPIESTYDPLVRKVYVDSIWRCDECLKVYIMKPQDNEYGKYLIWKPYNFETGPN